MIFARPLTLLAFSSMAFLACPPAPQPDPIPPSPKVVRFDASRPTLAKGERTTLRWEVTDATTVGISDINRGSVSGVNNKLSGAIDVQIEAATLFLLTATNARGAKTVAVVSVDVEGGASAGVIFAAYPEQLAPGQTSTLVWRAPGARSVALRSGATDVPLMGQRPAAGSIVVNPTAASTDYTLIIDGDSRTLTVRRAPEIVTFKSNRASGLAGETITVDWQTRNATSIVVRSTGTADLRPQADGGTPEVGSVTDAIPAVPVGSVLTYTLEATGPGGTNRSALTVVVGTGPKLTSLTAPQYAKTGASFTLRWTSVNADETFVSTDAGTLFTTSSLGTAADGGFSIATPATATMYTVTASNTVSGERESRQAIVEPVGPTPAMPTFTAMPATIATAGTPVTLTWNVPNARAIRVLQDGELTVAFARGRAAEMGTAVVYPNSASTRYTLAATNTIDPEVSATVTVALSGQALTLQSPDGGLIFDTAPTAELNWSLGATPPRLAGLADDSIVSTSNSTGFIDISDGGTPLTFASRDDGTAIFTPQGFETFLFGTRLASPIVVSTNGWLAFSASTTLTATPTPPNPFPGTSVSTNLLAPLWLDLDLGTTGQVLWQLLGSAPRQTLVVQFDKVRAKGQAASELTFQVQVEQSGSMRFEYRTMSFTPPTMASQGPVIGLQGAASRGLRGSLGGPNSSVAFFSPRLPPLQAQPSSLPVRGFLETGSGLMRVSSVAPFRASNVTITEVMYNPSPTLAQAQWFELANNSTLELDLSGWLINFGDGGTHTIASGTRLPGNSVRVFAQSADAGDNDVAAIDYAYGASVMPNAGTLSVGPGFAFTGARWGLSAADAGGVVTFEGRVDAGVSVTFDPTPRLFSTDVGTAPAPTARACASRTPFGASSPRQLGSPGALSVCGFASMTRITPDYVDISATGTKLSFASLDDSTVTIPLTGGTVQVNGQAVTQLSICTNGWMVPGLTMSTSLSNKTKPSATDPFGSLMAPYWDDLHTGSAHPGAGVYYQRFTGPRPHWVVAWHRIATYNLGPDLGDLSFEVKLFDDGIVEYHYGAMSFDARPNGEGATVWFESASGLEAAVYSVNTQNSFSNLALRFAAP